MSELLKIIDVRGNEFKNKKMIAGVFSVTGQISLKRVL